MLPIAAFDLLKSNDSFFNSIFVSKMSSANVKGKKVSLPLAGGYPFNLLLCVL
jgi:hypothetical protein